MDVTRNTSRAWDALITMATCLVIGTASQLSQSALTDGLAWRPEIGWVLALLLLRPKGSLPLILLGAWMADVILLSRFKPDVGWDGAAAIALVRALAVGGGALALLRWLGPNPDFRSLLGLRVLILFPCCFIGSVAAAFETVVVAYHRQIDADTVAWGRVWARDWLGCFLVTSWVSLVVQRWSRGWVWRPRAHLPAFVVLLLTAAGAWYALYAPSEQSRGLLAFIYLPFPVLIWAALRLGPIGVSTCCFVFCGIILHQLGDMPWFTREGALDRQVAVIWLQLYVLATSFTVMLLACTMYERQQAAAALEQSEGRYRALAEELRVTERQARKTEDLYRRAITAAHAVPYLRDYRSEKFTFIGSNIKELTGYSSAEMTPELWDVLVQEHVMHGWARGLGFLDAVKVVRKGEQVQWQADVLILSREGRKTWVADTSIEILDDNGIPIGSIGILTDITERKLAEVAVRKLNEGLEGRMMEQTAELESAVRELESFTFSVANDLRAPLRAIEGFSRIIHEDHGKLLGEEATGLLARVRVAATRMDMLIHNLLLFSRLSRQPVARQAIDINRIVSQSFEALRPEQLDRKIEFQHDELPGCHGDPELLRHVIHQLLSNALKFTRKRETARIRVGVRKQEGGLAYFVEDNGTGFDMAYADKLFGMFQRLHRADEFDGSGVGLAIAHRLIRRHGGRIWAHSQVDQGTVFYFVIPPEVAEEPRAPHRMREEPVG